MPKTIAQLKRRLQRALAAADEAEVILPLIRQAVSTYGFEPKDIFDRGTPQDAAHHLVAPQHGTSRRTATFGDGQGNTWSGRGRRPTWLNAALARGASLEYFRRRK